MIKAYKYTRTYSPCHPGDYGYDTKEIFIPDYEIIIRTENSYSIVHACQN